MSVISTGDFAKDLEPLTGVWVDQGSKRYPEQFKQFFKTVNYDGAYFEDQMYSSLGMLQRKPQGEAIRYDKMSQRWGKRHTATAYALGVNVTYEEIRDGVALDMAQRVLTELGRSAAELRNTVVHNVLNNAFSSSYVGGDGIELCSTVHPTDEGTTSNELATPASLSIASLKQSYIEMKSMTDLRGNKLHFMPKKLVIPRELVFDAAVIMKSVDDPTTSDRSVNPWGAVGLFNEVVVSDWLTSATKHFIMTDNQDRGLIFFERDPLMTFRDKDTDTMNAKFVVYTRFGAAWTDYNCIFGNAI